MTPTLIKKKKKSENNDRVVMSNSTAQGKNLKQKAALSPNDPCPAFGAHPDAKLAISNHNAARTQL